MNGMDECNAGVLLLLLSSSLLHSDSVKVEVDLPEYGMVVGRMLVPTVDTTALCVHFKQPYPNAKEVSDQMTK